jgi:plastocyanin
MDAPSPAGQNVEVGAFYPLKVNVRPGDTLVLENLSSQAPHTVTFGVPAFDDATPSLITKAGLENPVVFGPCYTAELPAPEAETCPTESPSEPPAYAGTGFWNSGVVAPGGKVALKIAEGTPVDTYIYSCLLHRNMAGQFEVVEKDSDRVAPAEVRKEGEHDRAALLAAAAKMAEPAPEANVVWAGWGNSLSAINRFGPPATTIKAGGTVTWKTASPFEAHTVTFESPFKTPGDAGVLTAGGVKSGARYSGGFAHSGLFGQKGFPADSFSLVFTKPGTYSYVCVLHPGMAGQVEVTP